MEPKLFYQQPAARVGDVIPQYIDGKYQLFYLKNWRDHNAPGLCPAGTGWKPPTWCIWARKAPSVWWEAPAT